MLPFSRDQFLGLFADYNEAIWPAQLIAYAFGLFVLGALLRRQALDRRIGLAGLAAMWLWTGVAYHGFFFSGINPAAVAFGSMFVAQGVLFLWMALFTGGDFRARKDTAGFAGVVLIAYALVIYPMIGLVEAPIARIPPFGVSPCPVALFTLGLLLLARPEPRLWLWVIPVAWSFVGGTAAFLLGIVQDWVLLLAGPLAAFLAFARHRRASELNARREAADGT